MSGTDEFVEQIGKHIDATVDNAVFLLDRLQARADGTEAEVADLRQQLAAHDAEANAACLDWDAKYRELEQRLADAEALVPETEWLEQICEIIRSNCPACENGIVGAEQHPNGVDWLAVECEYCGRIIAAVRDWHEEQGREGESDGN